MQALVEKGHTVYAICPEGDFFHKFKDSGVNAIAYSIDRSSINPFKELKAISNIFQAIKALKLDILHTFTAKPNIYGTIAGKMAKVPTIINLVEGLGSFYVEDDLKSKIMRRIIEFGYKIIFSFSKVCVFVNHDDPLYLQDQGVISKDKSLIIKSVGVDTECFSADTVDRYTVETLKNELNPEDKFIVLMIARAIWHKGIREFYEAANLVQDKNVQFILVGGTDSGNPSCADESYLRNGKVRWLGYRSDIKELLSMCDLFVLPSYREGVPRTLLEAASMQKAIITTDTVGCREVVEDGVNGYLIPTRDSEKLAYKVLELMDEPELCQKMGILGREKMMNDFDVKIVVEQYIDLYKRYENV